MTSRRLLEEVFHDSLEKLDLERRVAATLPRFRSSAREARGPVIAVAIGKAAPAMAKGALTRWGDVIEEVLVVTTDGTDVSTLNERQLARRVEVLRAGHPLPDTRSVRAAERCLEIARDCADRDALLLVLVSGGASALVCAPARGVGLREKRSVTRAMLSSGATIHEINIVRKHLSRIKGGGLARAASPAKVMTLVASDVIGGEATDVGSGPSVGDDSRVSEARRLLRLYAPRLSELPLVRTGPAPNAKRPIVVASPEELARVVRDELRARGFSVRVLPPSLSSVDALAREYDAIASKLGPRSAVVRTAEPSIVVPSEWTNRRRGSRDQPTRRGGRSTHLAALVGRSLPLGVTFLAGATDGVDGVSETAGAIVDGGFRDLVSSSSVEDAIRRFDTGSMHLRAGTALPLAPTGHNLADLHVLVREEVPDEKDPRRVAAISMRRGRPRPSDPRTRPA